MILEHEPSADCCDGSALLPTTLPLPLVAHGAGLCLSGFLRCTPKGHAGFLLDLLLRDGGAGHEEVLVPVWERGPPRLAGITEVVQGEGVLSVVPEGQLQQLCFAPQPDQFFADSTSSLAFDCTVAPKPEKARMCWPSEMRSPVRSMRWNML